MIIIYQEDIFLDNYLMLEKIEGNKVTIIICNANAVLYIILQNNTKHVKFKKQIKVLLIIIIMSLIISLHL